MTQLQHSWPQANTAIIGSIHRCFGVLPHVYICLNFPPSDPGASLGILVAVGSLVVYRLTHRALWQFWSVSLDLREQHALLTDGIDCYVRRTRLWAIAQALLLPNWVAGFAAIVGFSCSLPRGEQLLLNRSATIVANTWREPIGCCPEFS